MKRRDITIIIVAITVAASIGYGISGSKRARELSSDIKELNHIINENQKSIKTLINEKDTLNESINTKDEIIQEQKIEMEKTLEELELARRRIEKINAKVSFDDKNVLNLSGATEVHMRRALEGTGLEDVADAFVEVEQMFGINAFLVAAIAAQESAWGTSDRSVYQNNLTGHAVYNSVSRGTYFDSRSESVINTGKLLKEEYLTPGGHSFNGYSVEAINKRYCFLEDGKTIDYNWCRSVISIAYALKNKANNF